MKNQDCCEKKSAGTSCEKTKCCITLLKGAFIGGVVMFLYLSASWILLPWHKTTIMSFKDESAVASALSGNAEKSGIYLLSQQKASKAKDAAMVQSKPFAFVSVFADGFDMKKNMKRHLGQVFLLCLFNALLLTALLKKGSCCGGCPIMFSMGIGLLVAGASHLPELIYYHFPLRYTLVGIADDFLSFTLAGAVIAKCILKSGSCTMGKGEEKASGCCH